MAIFGAYDRTNQYETGQARMYINNLQPGQVIRHPLYNPNTLINDVALIRLPYKVEVSPYIQPVKLPKDATNFFQTYSKTQAVISGWGKTQNAGTVVSQLQYGYVEILDLNDCMAHYLPGLVTKGNICLDTKKSGVSSCNGDSGGPMVSTVTGELIGVTSFGSAAGCEHGAPAGYTFVSPYREWIRYHTDV